MLHHFRRFPIFIMVVFLGIMVACARSAQIESPSTEPISQTTSAPKEQTAVVGPLPSEKPTSTMPPATEEPTITNPLPTDEPITAQLPTNSTLRIEKLPAESPADVQQKLGFHSSTAIGDQRYVVILVDFPNVKRKISEAKLSERMLKFLNNYFSQASYMKLNLVGRMTKHYILPHPVEYYKISPRNLEVDDAKVLALLKDVFDAADADIEFRPDLYVMIALGSTNEEYGMVGYCALPGMLGFKSDTPFTTKSGEMVKNVAVFCENAHLGTYVHDTLHMLGGVVEGQRLTPCLYDHDLQAKYPSGEDWGKNLINIGYWDPLSSHFAYKRDLPPTGLSSWTKLRLGWVDPAKITLVTPGETRKIWLDPLVDENARTLVIKIPISETTYYLVENRQPEGYDANLPSSGVVVMYADDMVLECRHGASPVKIMDANPDVPYLNDAAYDIGKKTIFLDPEHNLAIVLLSKDGNSYEVMITTPEQTGTQ